MCEAVSPALPPFLLRWHSPGTARARAAIAAVATSCLMRTILLLLTLMMVMESPLLLMNESGVCQLC